jgi:excisionase family DNA binding protein
VASREPDWKESPVADRTSQERRTYLRSSEVAELLHVSPKTVARWAKEGKLPCLRTLGGHRRYPEREIRALLDDLEVLHSAQASDVA